MKLKRLILLFVVLCGIFVEKAMAETPLIGAQVFIEPGQTDTEIDEWFSQMNASGMSVCRIRMFEEYMHRPDGTWDFSLFDKAFYAAEKYGIKVFATLFPSTAPNAENSVGGFKFPLSDEHEKQIQQYIEHIVNHYKSFSSLYGWVLMNEPGTGGYLPETNYTKKKFEEWKKHQTQDLYRSKNYTLLKSFDRQKFLVNYNTWYLSWLAAEIAKQDTTHEIHVNNHQIFENVAEYDFPAWRKFLTSLGASAHPSWHFGYFKRSQYNTAISANCNIIRSGAGNLPFWVTELQGGNNTFSGANPFCPTAEETAQWLWTSIATGVQGVIFWSLNPRSIGEEAGEWALLDFQNRPSDRMAAVSGITKCIKENKPLFTDVKPVNFNINILYNRQSLWIEKVVQYGYSSDCEGRQPGGVMKSALAYYEILSENGVVPNLAEFAEFDWTKSDYTGVNIILANAISLPSDYWEKIRRFVQCGGSLFVEGITGFYDENMLSLFNTGFPLQDVFGGALQEVKCIPGDFMLNIGDSLPAHLWKGSIYNVSAKVIGMENNLITATTHTFGKGKVIWIPSLLGLGAWRTGNSQALSKLLMKELPISAPIRFEQQEKGLFMQTSQGKTSLFSIIVNKTTFPKIIQILSGSRKGKIIFSNKSARLTSGILTINPEETVVIEWQK